MDKFINITDLKLRGVSVFDENLEILIPLSEVRKALQMATAVDAVEVVRCKDCTRGFGKFIRHERVVECQLYHHDDKRQYKDPMDYCSHGVRREKDGDL